MIKTHMNTDLQIRHWHEPSVSATVLCYVPKQCTARLHNSKLLSLAERKVIWAVSCITSPPVAGNILFDTKKKHVLCFWVPWKSKAPTHLLPGAMGRSLSCLYSAPPAVAIMRCTEIASLFYLCACADSNKKIQTGGECPTELCVHFCVLVRMRRFK